MRGSVTTYTVETHRRSTNSEIITRYTQLIQLFPLATFGFTEYEYIWPDA